MKPYVQFIDWLLEEDQPSVRYHTLVDLLGRKQDDPEVKAAYLTIPRVGWAHDPSENPEAKHYGRMKRQDSLRILREAP